MKNIVLCFLFSFSFVDAFTQQATVEEFAMQNKEWNVRWRMITGAPYDYNHLYSLKYYISRDTVINGKEYRKMYCNDQYKGENKKYLLSLYEDNGMVYFIADGQNEEHLLYDFTANTGDWVRARGLSSSSDSEFFVWKKEQKKIGGEDRCCLLVVLKDDYHSMPEEADDTWAENNGEWWIEGIGTENSPVEHAIPGFVGSVRYLEYCKNEEGKVLYQRDYTPPVCLVDENMSWVVEYKNGDVGSVDADVEKLHLFFDPKSRGEFEGSFCRFLSASLLGDEGNAHIVAAMLEEDGKVYIIPWKRAQQSFLLYDFSANAGEVVEVVGVPASNRYDDDEAIPDLYHAKCRVERVEEVEVKGVRRRCLYVQEVKPNEDFMDSSSYNDIWIEGIGSVRGILGNVSFEIDRITPNMKLLECAWSDEVYYLHDESVFPASILPVTTAHRNDTDLTKALYDLSGRQLQIPSKGIRIIRYNDGTTKKVYTR